MRQRIGVLRRYRWSSYRAYIGLEAGPPWLERREVLMLGGRVAEGFPEGIGMEIGGEILRCMRRRRWR